MMRQETEWGYIDWEYLPDPKNPKRWFSVGKTTILPGRRQPPHVHYGYEQLLYVLSGEADARFNGVDVHAKAGNYYILEADTTHEAVNNGDEPYSELLVTNPIPPEPERELFDEGNVTEYKAVPELEEKNRRRLNAAAENLKTNLLRNISIPFCLFDQSDNVVLKNDAYPDFCLQHCDPVNAPRSCACYERTVADAGLGKSGTVTGFVCPYGLLVYLMPVMHKGMLTGTLRGGQHFSSGHRPDEARPEQPGISRQGLPSPGPSHSEAALKNYDTPYAAELSIEKTLQRIVGSLQRYCDILDSVEALSAQKEELNRFMQKTSRLERDLSTVEEKVTNLKIDHHFLFNTLNCLADMSLSGDRMNLYQSIIDLSKLFRYTMVQNAQMVPLSQEIEYLRSYLNLQKLRYGDSLSLGFDLDSSCLAAPVPFNFLQPIAENAFTHAFLNFDKKKKIDVRVSRADKEHTVITISNNGNPPAEEDIDRISLSWASGSGHGLSFIHDKLRACFGDRFEMMLSVSGKKQKITSVTVELPLTGACP